MIDRGGEPSWLFPRRPFCLHIKVSQSVSECFDFVLFRSNFDSPLLN